MERVFARAGRLKSKEAAQEYMIKGGKSGRTPLRNGLKFEKRSDFATVLGRVKGYRVKDDAILFRGKEVGRLYKKYKLYSKLLGPKGIAYAKLVSKKLLPDDAVLVGPTLFIIEQKFQSGPGSVDEKLQTCDFKLKMYKKLAGALGLKVKYAYVLNEWFKKKEYNDVLNYIQSVGCDYFFEELPLAYLELPVADD